MLAATDPGGSGCPPRKIYIDLGLNWCNTARLFETIGTGTDQHGHTIDLDDYEVYGFEASPLLWPFAEEYFRFLNGQRPEPELCLPKTAGLGLLTGISGGGLAAWTGPFGCGHLRHNARLPYDSPRMRCLYGKIEPFIAASLQPEPTLNSTAVVKERLTHAKCTARQSSERKGARLPRFTFIPAAAGGNSSGGKWLDFYQGRINLLTGGGMFKEWASSPEKFRVRMVNVADWIASSFSEQDHIVLKVDIEGAEHHVLPEMITRGLMPMINVLSYECHTIANGKWIPSANAQPQCIKLNAELRAAAPNLQLSVEGVHHFGADLYNSPYTPGEMKTLVSACNSVRHLMNSTAFKLDLSKRQPRPACSCKMPLCLPAATCADAAATRSV